jgi:hypothetical protein
MIEVIRSPSGTNATRNTAPYSIERVGWRLTYVVPGSIIHFADRIGDTYDGSVETLVHVIVMLSPACNDVPSEPVPSTPVMVSGRTPGTLSPRTRVATLEWSFRRSGRDLGCIRTSCEPGSWAEEQHGSIRGGGQASLVRWSSGGK